MNLEIFSKVCNYHTKLNKRNDHQYIYNGIVDSVDNKKKYGIPLEPIIIEEKDIIKEEIEIVDIKIEKPVIKDNSKLLSLTFDDGPSKYTKDLIEVLDKYDSKATFFILGNNIKGNEAIIKNISSKGHQIGIHGYSHTPFTNMDVDDVNAEIAGTYDMLSRIDVRPTNIVRPPFGKLNETIKEQVNYPFVLWNIDTDDVKNQNKENIKTNIRKQISEGSIILMHDLYPTTVEAVDEIIPELIGQGYKFVTLSDMNKRYDTVLKPGKVYAKIKEFDDYAA